MMVPCGCLFFVSIGDMLLNQFGGHGKSIDLLSRPASSVSLHRGYLRSKPVYEKTMIMTPSISFNPGQAISRAAEIGLKLKLRKQSEVKVEIAGGISELAQGRLRGANVFGTDWMSPGMLTCRTISCTVGPASIDLNKLARGAIELTHPVSGQCAVDLTAADFANFLCHPKVAAAAAASQPPLGAPFRFLRQARIDPAAVLLAVAWRGGTARMALSQRADGRAAVRPLASAGEDREALDALATALAAFFDALVSRPLFLFLAVRQKSIFSPTPAPSP